MSWIKRELGYIKDSLLEKYATEDDLNREESVIVNCGLGQGKTTAALGLGLRAVGAGLKVHMVQFMKGRRYSEIDAIKNLSNFTISQFGRDEFVNKEKPEKIDIDLAQKGLAYSKDVIKSGKYDLVILDEINVAVDYKLVSLEDVLNLIKEKPKKLELVLTGRYAHQEIVKISDVVTEMLEIKHPYQNGVNCRKGIDF